MSLFQVFIQSLSEADGGCKRSANTFSAIRLCVASASTPVSLQKHEVFLWHHATSCLHQAEHVDAERETFCVCIIGWRLIGSVWEQSEVTVPILVAVVEYHIDTIYLSTTHHANTQDWRRASRITSNYSIGY